MSESNGLRESGEQRNEKPVLGRSKSFGDLNSGSSSVSKYLIIYAKEISEIEIADVQDEANFIFRIFLKSLSRFL
jgi:hypothetical protein